MSCIITTDCNITEDSPEVLCPSRPYKMEVSKKLENLSELRGLRKDVQRIAVALEKLAGIGGRDSEEEQFLWLESKRKDRQSGGGRKS